MSEFYWIFEYFKVMLAYAALFYVWPAVLFHGHLRGKGVSYRFAFCSLVTPLLLTTVISLLGIAHLLHAAVVGVLFYGIFLVRLLQYRNPFPEMRRKFLHIQNGTLTWQRVLLNAGLGLLRCVSKLAAALWRRTAGKRIRYAMLLLALLYGTVYFSFTALQFHSYGASDQYVHHAWIYALTEGTIYPKGIYPEGMHCVIYTLSTMFGIRIYSVNLFLAGIHAHATLLAAYLMMREIFHSKFTPIFALVTVLSVNLLSVVSVSAMSRIGWTLPQELAFPAVFLCAYSLIRFLESPDVPAGTKLAHALSPRTLLRDENLTILLLAVAVTLAVHFYATIMAVFICAVAFIVYLLRAFHWKKLLQLIPTVMLALVIAVAPMAIALAAGYQFQGSIHWAIAVTKGGEKSWAEGTYDRSAPNPEKKDTESAGEEDTRSTFVKIKDWVWTLYYGTWQQIYPGERGFWLCILTLTTAAVSGVFAVAHAALRRRRKRRGENGDTAPGCFTGYLCASGSLLLMILEYDPSLAGLPIFISGSRLCFIIELFGVMVCFCVFDLLLYYARRRVSQQSEDIVSAAVCFGIYALLIFTGHFHGYLYNELTRYPEMVDLLERITLYAPRDMYTVVSTTDEYYQLLGYGFHEETIDFVDRRQDRTYTIPTPYFFVFVEKAPLYYGQILFSSGPDWIAGDGYEEVIKKHREDVSTYPAIIHGETSADIAEKPFSAFSRRSDAASTLENREIMESQAIQWLEVFSNAHPQDGSIVYEDEHFLCYCVHQNEQCLFSLGIVD